MSGKTTTRLTPEAIRMFVESEVGIQRSESDSECRFPTLGSRVHFTPAGTKYLKDPGVALVSRPSMNMSAVQPFLDDVEPDSDYWTDHHKTPIGHAASLVKLAGQLCYLSFGKERSRNTDASRYLANLKAQGHGSVTEHANYSILLWGISRALTHEMVRHRSGMAYSQVSQRYVPARRLRFVEAYEYRNDPEAHASFERWIDASAAEYQRREDAALERERLLNMASCDDEIGYVATPPTTEDRKRVRQAARRCLPNETEAPILVTGNLRALRHCIESRCSAHADVEIRRAFWRVLLILASVDPILWEDYTATQLPDGTWSVETPYRKV